MSKFKLAATVFVALFTILIASSSADDKRVSSPKTTPNALRFDALLHLIQSQCKAPSRRSRAVSASLHNQQNPRNLHRKSHSKPILPRMRVPC
jgi:hypothetical protein